MKKVDVILGLQWGDEGKGKVVDVLTPRYEVVARFQGGPNAGHTLEFNGEKYVLRSIPSGIFQGGKTNIIGNGVVVDLEHLCHEAETLRKAGISVTPDNLKLSSRAIICMPYHKMQDIMEEERLADKKFGSTRRGIAPVYADKYMKKGIRMESLLHMDTLYERVCDIVEWKNITVTGYGHAPIDPNEIMEWLKKYGSIIAPYVTDVSEYLSEAVEAGKNIMFEAQLGALRDIDFGIYPYTSSSQTLAHFGPIGAGIPGVRLNNSVGIMKAYSTCVGEGPFTAEMFGDEAEKLRAAGGEYGAATGRPRRVGPFDVPASRYGVKVQGADYIALTKLDVLSYMDRIRSSVLTETLKRLQKIMEISLKI